MNFKEVLMNAKAKEEEAVCVLLEMYKPLLLKNAVINGRLDEDLYQELCITFLHCVELFKL